MTTIINRQHAGLLLLLLFVFASCDKYLDVLPDNRAELDSDKKITELLVSAYPESNYYLLAEMSSDNIDENADQASYTAYTKLQEQAATWQDITDKYQDTPYALWMHCYKAIAAANNVLIAIAEKGNPKSLDPQRGEALICRAYSHFILANIFCMAYSPKTCDKELGITFMTKAESEVSPHYERGTLAEIYGHIRDDIEAGLPLLNDEHYSVPKYHFNTKAAYAFAARFYLYYMQEDKSNLDKCIEYATRVLTNNPASMLRDWKTVGAVQINNAVRSTAYIDANEKANLLIISTESIWEYYYGPTLVGLRYTHNDKIAETESVKCLGFWGNSSAFYFNIPTYSNMPKVVMQKMSQFWQITDVVNQTGYPYIMAPAFTTDLLLMDRAEAYALKGQYALAREDLTTWMHAFTTTRGNVTAELLEKRYGTLTSSSGITGTEGQGMAYYEPTIPTPKKRLNPDFTVQPGEQENLIHAILHARRVLSLHEGQRWFDVKRYGIEIYRRTVKDGNITVYDTMTKDDPRRALQLPQSVINAGITPNPRWQTAQ